MVDPTRLSNLGKVLCGLVNPQLPVTSQMYTEPTFMRAERKYSYTNGCQSALPLAKATPNKLSVSRPGLKHICMRAGGSFSLFHHKIG